MPGLQSSRDRGGYLGGHVLAFGIETDFHGITPIDELRRMVDEQDVL